MSRSDELTWIHSLAAREIVQAGECFIWDSVRLVPIMGSTSSTFDRHTMYRPLQP